MTEITFSTFIKAQNLLYYVKPSHISLNNV